MVSRVGASWSGVCIWYLTRLIVIMITPILILITHGFSDQPGVYLFGLVYWGVIIIWKWGVYRLPLAFAAVLEYLVLGTVVLGPRYSQKLALWESFPRRVGLLRCERIEIDVGNESVNRVTVNRGKKEMKFINQGSISTRNLTCDFKVLP